MFSFTSISIARQPSGFHESAEVAKGAEVAKVAKGARVQLEKRSGKPAVSKLNAKNLKQRLLKDADGA